ncbi:methylmalonyl Co-A mutase-associated GTPase MeaB [Spongiactinospora sp. 9N601]|uniref:methylmalonyl Co-A mutase-associated GTPase MeaB n=1 Tax=Spongiactinospora sp. 9N601 TaxID=3375149 RepID=UPI0037B45872
MTLLRTLLAGEPRALARAISLVERGDPAGERLVVQASAHAGTAAITGITGPPGVGKSTLVGALVRELRTRDDRVAVLSVDPTSPFTGGALLGDRIRLADHFLDEGVFIRSLASRGSLGGLAAAVRPAALLADAAGYSQVLIETVGIGQAEVDIAGQADTTVVVLMPGAGDTLQAIKAGLMEIPDVLVVNKADHPRADDLVRELRRTARFRARTAPIVKTNALTGDGIAELADVIAGHRSREHGRRSAGRQTAAQREIVRLATDGLRLRVERLLHGGDEGRAALEAVAAGHRTPESAARWLIAELTGEGGNR